MALPIKVAVSPSPVKIGRILGELGEDYANWMPAWVDLLPTFEKEAPKGITTQGKALIEGKPWPKLAQKTLSEKKRLGLPSKPLVRTGNLVGNLGSRNTANVSYGPTWVRYAPGDEYAYPLHYGEDAASASARTATETKLRKVGRKKRGARTDLRPTTQETVSSKRAARRIRADVRKRLRAIERAGAKMSANKRKALKVKLAKQAAKERGAVGFKVAGGDRLPARPMMGTTKGLPQKVEATMNQHAEELARLAMERLASQRRIG